MSPHLARICRYPVKGLSVEELDEVILSPGESLPGDRRFAIARGSAGVDTVEPDWASKQNFVTLLRTERLAQLTTRFDAESGELSILRGGRPVAKGRITDPTGRTVIDQFLAAFLKDDVNRTPRLVDAGEAGHLLDRPQAEVSIINLASVRDVERVAKQAIDPVRFRGNLLIDGLAPWVEFEWADREIAIGNLRLRVTEPIVRCAATDVNPETAKRDTNLPKLLKRGFGHVNMGMLAEVTAGGTLQTGDSLTPPD
jgi:hypothetical protein